MTASGYLWANSSSESRNATICCQQSCRACPKPQPHVERNLLIAAAAGVNLVGQTGDLRFQLANDEGVDVLIVGAIEVVRIVGLFTDGSEGGNQCRALLGSKDARARQGCRKCLGAFDVGMDQLAVEMQRPGELFEHLGRPGFESSAPQFHG